MTTPKTDKETDKQVASSWVYLPGFTVHMVKTGYCNQYDENVYKDHGLYTTKEAAVHALHEIIKDSFFENIKIEDFYQEDEEDEKQYYMQHISDEKTLDEWCIKMAERVEYDQIYGYYSSNCLDSYTGGEYWEYRKLCGWGWKIIPLKINR